MTLIAGFRCEGGIVLCADTQETSGVSKFSVDKLEAYEKPWCRLGIAGSGNYGDIVDTVVDRIKSGLDRDKPNTFEGASRSISATLIDVNNNEVSAYPTSKPEDKVVELLIALRPKKENRAELWAAAASALHPVIPGFDVRGIGEAVRFLAKRLFRANLSLIQGVLLSAYLLGVSKEYVVDVGGESHILVLTSDGGIYREHVKETELSETFLGHFDTVLSNLLLAYADTSLTERQFEEKLYQFSELTKKLRKELCAQFTKQHLGWAISDPDYVGDPYHKLPDGSDAMLGPIHVSYSFFDHITLDDPDVLVNPNSPRHASSKKTLPKKQRRKKATSPSKKYRRLG